MLMLMIDETTKISLSLFTVPAIVSAIIVFAYKVFSAKFWTTYRVEKLEEKCRDHLEWHTKLEARVEILERVSTQMDIRFTKIEAKLDYLVEGMSEIKKKLN